MFGPSKVLATRLPLLVSSSRCLMTSALTYEYTSQVHRRCKAAELYLYKEVPLVHRRYPPQAPPSTSPIIVYSPQPPKRRRECVKRASRITNQYINLFSAGDFFCDEPKINGKKRKKRRSAAPSRWSACSRCAFVSLCKKNTITLYVYYMGM